MWIALAGVGVVALAGAALAAPGDPVVIEQGAEVRVAPRTDAPVLKRVGEEGRAIERDRRGGWVEIEIPALLVQGWLPLAGVAPAPQGDTSEGPGSRAATDSPQAPASPPQSPPLPPPQPPAAVRDQAGGARVPLAKPDVAAGAALGGGRLGRLLEPPPPGLMVEPPPPPGTEPAAVERFRASVRYLDAKPETPRRMFGSVRWLRDGVVEITATERWTTLAPDERAAWLATLFDRWLAASGSPGALQLEIRDPGGNLMTRAEP
jgi:hypothetical protein